MKHYYFIFLSSSSLYSYTTDEHSTSSAGGIRKRFLNSSCAAGPKPLARAAPRREPETNLREECDEADDAGETGEESLPKPIQVGNILFKCQLPTHNAIHTFGDDAAGKRMLKRYLASNEFNYFPDVYTDADRASATKLPAAIK